MARQKNIIKCPQCGETRRHEARGLCKTCYNRIKETLPTRPKVKCLECGEIKPHKARQRCRQCYTNWLRRKHYREGRPTSKVMVNCKCCEEYKNHKSKGLCQKCYDKLKHYKKYHTSKEYREKQKIRKNDRLRISKENKKCIKCGTMDNLELHHNNYGETRTIKIMCRDCHKRFHNMLKDI